MRPRRQGLGLLRGPSASPLGAMRLSALFISVVLLVACSGGAQVHERKAYWEQAVSANIRPGTSRQEASRWLSSRGATPYEEKRSPHILSAKVEEIPTRYSLVCSYWSIMVHVFFDDADRAVRNEVDASGTCL